MTPPVAVAVVSWNTRDLLGACLRSLEPEVRDGRATVWVVENASTDGSQELVEREHAWARLLALGDNRGFGAGVNRVAAEAEGHPFIACANADVELEPGALAELVRAAAADPRAGALAPRLILPDGTTQHSVHPFPTLPFTLAFNLGLHRLSPRLADAWALEGFWDDARPRRVPWALGAFLLLRREAWDAVGGFDERQWMYAEDLDLGWRLRRAGWSTRYVPAARVRHRSAAATEQAFGAATTLQWQRSTYAWMLRTRGLARTRAVAAVNVAGAAARWLVRVPLARRDAARWAHERDAYRGWARSHLEGLRPRSSLERHA